MSVPSNVACFLPFVDYMVVPLSLTTQARAPSSING
jgi:hypothetical protein